MKNIYNNKLFVSVIMFFGLISANSQILTNNGQSPLISNSNVLLDGSSNFSTEAGAGANIGKGIIIPSVDLVNFAFDLTLADGSTFPTYFDGMIVYNNATGSTLTSGNRSAISTSVTPGFYYFSNPNGASNENVTGGEWKPLGSGGGSQSSVVADCDVNGFVGAYMNGFALSGASFSTTITNNGLSAAGPITFAAGDLVLSGVTGLTVGTPTPTSATVNPGATQLVSYPITGTPAATGTLTGTWSKLTLSCSDTKTVAGLAAALNDANYCTNATVNGAYMNGFALSASNTFTVTITNNSGSTINGFPAPNVSNLTRTWSGTGTINVASVSPATTFNLANGASQIITYTLSGTPTSTGTLTLDWAYSDLTCQKVRNIGLGDATLSLPAGASVLSICQGAGCSQINIQGVVDNTANQKIVNVAYTGGLGSYDAYTSGWIASNSGTGEGGDTNSFRISYPAGTFSASGTIPVTIEVDGDGSFNALKIAPGNSELVATMPLNVNGDYRGDVTLKIVTCGAPTSTGGFLVFKCHNLGADESADPFTPSWQLNGAYFQWGKKPVDTNGDGYRTKPNSGTEGFAAAPTGPGAGETNEAAVASWSTSPAADGAWNLTEGSPVKTANDPCPSGYRVPTRNEWVSIYSTTPVNTQTNWSNVGTYSNSSTNYTAGKNVNNSLYLPASGYRGTSSGTLYDRGNFGYYWSSTENGGHADTLYFNSGSVNPAYLGNRTAGCSVRCVAE